MKVHLLHRHVNNEFYESTKMAYCLDNKLHFHFSVESHKGAGRLGDGYLGPCDCEDQNPAPKEYAPLIERALLGEDVKKEMTELNERLAKMPHKVTGFWK